MNVVIRPKHCIGTGYDHQNDGPLINACKEQLSDTHIVKEFDGYCVDADGRMYSFDTSNNGYNRLTFSALADKEIKEIKLDLVPVRLSGGQAVWDAG